MVTETQTGVLIPYIIEMFRFQTWMAMGKVANPVSGEIERNLDAARQMIDLLGELEVRTEGNRSEDETKLLQGVLTELRMNFLDESKKPQEPAATSEEAPSEAEVEVEVEESSDEAEQSDEIKQSETESA
jgi:hypothetical protein